MTTPRARIARDVLLLSPLLAMLLAGCPQLSGWMGSRFELGFNVGGTPTPVAVAGTPAFRSAPVFESVGGKIGSHAPTIAAFADGELLAAWYSYTGPGELDGAAIYTARRPAGGDVWDTPELLIERPVAVGNPVLYSEGDGVWLFFAVVPDGWSTAQVEFQWSEDRGRLWSPANVIAGPLGANVRNPPVRTADGSLLLPAYDDLIQRSLFFASADGQSWSLRSALATVLPYQNLQPTVAPLADGRLLAVMRNSGRGWLWVTASEDSGWSWATPADSGFPNPGSSAQLLRLASGNLILVYNDSNTERHPLSVTISADEGRTWYAPRMLVDGDGAYAYPAVVQAPDGLIHILYSHNRERIQHLTLNEAWIVAGT